MTPLELAHLLRRKAFSHKVQFSARRDALWLADKVEAQ